MVAELAKADVVFLGEQHDDPGTHRLQAAVLEGLARRRSGPIVLALEMFERDAQPALDAWLRGASSEADFLAVSRPWPNHQNDYRPLIEIARAENWPVVAGNVPRRLAQAVSRRGPSRWIRSPRRTARLPPATFRARGTNTGCVSRVRWAT